MRLESKVLDFTWLSSLLSDEYVGDLNTRHLLGICYPRTRALLMP